MDNEKKFEAIDGETLLDMDIPSTKFIIKGLLPQGLAIIAGAPKIGKSWLMLDWCVKIAKGESIWSFKTTQGTTLYLCLEDNHSRIQDRLLTITDEVTRDVYFVTSCCSLADGLEEQIRNFVKEHSDTVLIVIDTLQMVRQNSRDTSYASDYKEIETIKKIADELQIAILLVHHMRKQDDKDPLNKLSGTNGIAGGVDTILTLDKSKRSQNNATMICTGRDIEYRELELNFNKEDCTWNIISDSSENPDMLLPEEMKLLIEFMEHKRLFKGTNTDFTDEFNCFCCKEISAKVLKRLMNKWRYELEDNGIYFKSYRSNGKRGLSISYRARSDDSDVKDDVNGCVNSFVNVAPIVPVATCKAISADLCNC